MNSGTIAFWALTIFSILAWLSVVIKLCWWKFSLGYWLFYVTAVLSLLGIFIFTLQLHIWPRPIEDHARAIIFGSMAFAMLLLVIDIWRKNWHHWAWSKEDTDEHSS